MKNVSALLLLLLLATTAAPLRAQTKSAPVRSEFEARTTTFGGIQLPYRVAYFHPELSSEPALVVYLHGGSSKGTDNEAQMQEAAVDSITNYLSLQSWPAVMLVPQCPTDKSWSGRMLGVLHQLIASYTTQSNVSPARVYLLGGSMGGTGTWSMLSAYPRLFAAAMPVAGNPSRCEADSVALTPLFTVMGTADAIMSVSTVEDFTARLTALGGEWRMEIEEGWTHEMTCIQSYTTPRLDWLFAHTRQTPANAISGPTATAADRQSVSSTEYFTLSGQRVEVPHERGIYVVRQHHTNGQTTVKKTVGEEL